MIEILPLSSESCLAVHFSGKVSGSEYQQFTDALSERLKAGGKVSLVLELTGFEFYGDLDSAKKDLKLGFGE
jgi:anti-anti-sigma regulatory factor